MDCMCDDGGSDKKVQKNVLAYLEHQVRTYLWLGMKQLSIRQCKQENSQCNSLIRVYYIEDPRSSVQTKIKNVLNSALRIFIRLYEYECTCDVLT